MVPTYRYKANAFPWLYKNPRSIINLRVVLEWVDKLKKVKRHQVKHPHKWKKQDFGIGMIEEEVEEEETFTLWSLSRRSILLSCSATRLGLISQYWNSIGYKILRQ